MTSSESTYPEPAVGPLVWGPRPVLSVVATAVAALAALWLVLADTPTDKFYAGVLTLLAVGAAAAGVLMRRRLEAGPDGMRIGTLTGVRTVRWSQVTGIDTVTRTHLGIGSAALHLDLGDDGLFIFGRIDLGTDPEDVATALNAVRPRW